MGKNSKHHEAPVEAQGLQQVESATKDTKSISKKRYEEEFGKLEVELIKLQEWVIFKS